MQLQFESDLIHQGKAVEAVCGLFRGQEICRTEFTVTKVVRGEQQTFGFIENDLGIGNRLTLLDDEILSNLNDIQIRNGLTPSAVLSSNDFSIEMETGTGKTYVYLRTIFELNKRYGFTKFVIVVPSIAIKEGVYKSIQIMNDHFRGIYSNVTFNFFPYDSSKLVEIQDFATSSHIQIMIVTVGAINKKEVNNLYKESDKIGGEKPIDLIRATRPILIVDEPQSVDGGLTGRGKEALGAMDPICTLRYSATHVDKYHMVYRLDAVDAYENGLVKQIEVASATIDEANNKPFVRLVSVSNSRGRISAKVELDVATRNGVLRSQVKVYDGDDLEQCTNRAIYRDCRIGEIRVELDNEFIELLVPGGEHYLTIGQVWGDVEPVLIQREMIRRTIREHLDKEIRLRPHGIKVLSLFFIDAVEKYRQYDEEGNVIKGLYARIFEEEYQRLIKHPNYHSLLEEHPSYTAEDVHGGYFSIDKKTFGSNTVDVIKNTRGDTKADDDTYNLIMRDKEKLLSLNTSLKFIFSHSALREGWDNPNVFQICTLRDIQSERERRQTIGRGLRLAVNQRGERVRGFDVNTLTVIATESYEQFAENLQKEIEDDTGIRFGIVEKHQFASILSLTHEGLQVPLGFEQSNILWEHLQTQGYITSQGKIEDSLKQALKDGSMTLPEEFEAYRVAIAEVLIKLSGRFEIKNADERKQVKARQAVLQSDEFKALWDRIKYKTTYRVQFDNEKLIQDCIRAVQEMPPIAKARLKWRKAEISIGKAGVDAKERGGAATVILDESDIELPDILTDLQDRTQLTRRTVQRILLSSQRIDDFKRNPQRFIELTAEVINRCKQLALVNGIKYHRMGDEHYYAQELLGTEELTGYLKNMLMDTEKSVYEHVIYDSDVEAHFAEQLERNSSVKVYAKLPGWFKVPTPLGSYNPDWAVLVETDGEERLYFVVETKNSLFTDDIRDREGAKIICGRAHFEACVAKEERSAQYIVARSVDDMFLHCF